MHEKKTAPDGALIFAKTFRALLLLPDELAGGAIKAAASYFLDGVLPDGLNLSVEIVFSLLRDDVETSLARFEKTVERNQRIAAQRRLVTTGNQSSPPVTNQTELNRTEPNRAELNQKNMADKPPRAARFAPPSLDDVREYCRERGNVVDPERWLAYYESVGWRVGKNPMKDWKAAVRTWERRGTNFGRNTDAHPVQNASGHEAEFDRIRYD